MLKVGLISLGCSKNLVDSEMVLGILSNAGIEIVNDPELADAIIINTCGFIESAKQEAVDTILEMKAYHKKLIVMGCYAQRYQEKLLQEMPFIDRIITIKDYPRIHLILEELFSNEHLSLRPMKYENRLLVESSFSPYVRISEGCNNHCAFCAIPLIRGHFISRPMSEIIEECKLLIQKGAKEINLISQDTSRYGYDLTTNHQSLLPELLEKISQIDGIKMLRMLYLYPDEISDELIQVVKNNPIVVPYFDIPIQHISSAVLKRMLRRKDEAFHKNLLYKIKSEIPNAVFRTTLITGFPGETEEDHQVLLDFVKSFEFDRLGVFTYSKEEGTKAYTYSDDIEEGKKQERYNEIMKVQKKIARKKNKEQIGKIHWTLIENFDPESKFYYGRSYAFAPDDIDGYIVFQSNQTHELGDYVPVKITSVFGYDLIGDVTTE